MVVFPSKIEFAAFLQYASHGQSEDSAKAKKVLLAVKRDGFVDSVRIIEHSAKRLAEELPKHPFLSDYFNDSVTLVPAPRSAPLVQNALWPALRICQTIRAKGLAANLLPCVERTRPVQKAATAGPGQRPNPDEHYDSTKVSRPPLLPSPTAITLVDDVITRGSSFMGLMKRLEEAFPGVPVRCFALIRTISSGDVPAILDPVQGTISFTSGQLSRHP